MFQFLFVLINGAVKSNFKSLNYFGLRPQDLPRVGIYDGDSDMKWLLPEGDISAERVRQFCESFLRGELKVSCCYLQLFSDWMYSWLRCVQIQFWRLQLVIQKEQFSWLELIAHYNMNGTGWVSSKWKKRKTEIRSGHTSNEAQAIIRVRATQKTGGLPLCTSLLCHTTQSSNWLRHRRTQRPESEFLHNKTETLESLNWLMSY